MIICKICNRELLTNSALGKHVTHTHKITTQQYYDTYYKTDLDGLCKTCGKPTKFISIPHGYANHCCRHCVDNDPAIIAKINTKEARIKKSISGKIALNNPQVQQRRIQTLKQTLQRKYSVDNVAKIPSVIDKMKQTILEQKEQFCIENDCVPRTYVIEKYGQGWLSLGIQCLKYKGNSYVRNKDLTIIDNYYNWHSVQENRINNFLEHIYGGEILRNRRIIYPQELDFYLPELNLAIEYNGSYYHCVGNNVGVKDKWYHYDKSKTCWLQGIRLIHIFEFENIYEQFKLLKDIIYYGFDNYNQNDPNKNWQFDDGHEPQIIGYYKEFPIYSA